MTYIYITHLLHFQLFYEKAGTFVDREDQKGGVEGHVPPIKLEDNDKLWSGKAFKYNSVQFTGNSRITHYFDFYWKCIVQQVSTGKPRNL